MRSSVISPVCPKSTSTRSQSPNVYDSLGQALQALGDPEAAREQFARAIALYVPVSRNTVHATDGATFRPRRRYPFEDLVIQIFKQDRFIR
jgi:hypothetical protein